jgi:uncharacterized damage-inducible protein DinB
MIRDHLTTLFDRDIRKLQEEIGNYTDEQKLWQVAPGISNSGGNLCLHLLGNLQHYIGHVLGKTDYTRNRPLEFSRKNVARKEMLAELEHTREVIAKTIPAISTESLAADYPEKVFDKPMSAEYFLVHLLAHLDYHLGQINYHRRMVDSYQPKAAD